MGMGSTLAMPVERRAKRVVPAREPHGAYPLPSRLTPRLQRTKDLVSQGMANKEIAALLGITVGAAKIYVSHVTRITRMSRIALISHRMGTVGACPPVSGAILQQLHGEVKAGPFE